VTTAVLVVNAGSSSIKFAVFAANDALALGNLLYRGLVERIDSGRGRFTVSDASGTKLDSANINAPENERLDHRHMLGIALDWLEGNAAGLSVVAAGHRVVHGGDQYTQPLRLTTAILGELEKLIPLAPLHQPHNLAAIQAVEQVKPGLPQVACFDTAFHRTQPEIAQMFAVPRWLTAEGIKRYGFHGLSYEYIAQVLPAHSGSTAEGRVVVAHLGNGASMCAMKGRKCVATTMAFTPIEGLMMGTRSGSIDPGVLIYLMQEKNMDAAAITDLLNKQSGLLGVSEIASDMRTLLDSQDPRARQAVDLFVYRIARELGSLAAALGGLDALVFTGGIGEHAVAVREMICTAAVWLGIELDPDANARGGPRLTQPDSRASAWVIPTNEELMIARHTCRLLAAA
jgi:acetate kinase